MSRGATVLFSSTVQPRGANEQRKGWLREKTNLGQMCDLTSFTSHTHPHTEAAAAGGSRKGACFCFMWQEVKVDWGDEPKAGETQPGCLKCNKMLQYNFARCCLQMAR